MGSSLTVTAACVSRGCRNSFPLPKRAAGRFAVSRLSASGDGSTSVGAGVADPNLSQEIRVYGTESGDMLLHLLCQPAVRSPENFDLAPDGRTLAVLGPKTLDLYTLPELTAKDRKDLEDVRTMLPPEAHGPVRLTRITRRIAPDETAPIATPSTRRLLTASGEAVPVPRADAAEAGAAAGSTGTGPVSPAGAAGADASVAAGSAPGPVRMWQITADRYKLPGCAGRSIDINLFRGTMDEFRAWVGEDVSGPTTVALPEWAAALDSWARGQGYAGPRPGGRVAWYRSCPESTGACRRFSRGSFQGLALRRSGITPCRLRTSGPGRGWRAYPRDRRRRARSSLPIGRACHARRSCPARRTRRRGRRPSGARRSSW